MARFVASKRLMRTAVIVVPEVKRDGMTILLNLPAERISQRDESPRCIRIVRSCRST